MWNQQRFWPSFSTSEIASALYFHPLKAEFSVLVSIDLFGIENVSQQQTLLIYFHNQTTRLQSAAVCSWRQTECIMWHNAGKRPRVSWLWCLHHAASPVPGTVFTLLTRRDIRTWPSQHIAATQNLYTDWLTNVHYDLLGLLSQPKIDHISKNPNSAIWPKLDSDSYWKIIHFVVYHCHVQGQKLMKLQGIGV